MADMREPGGRHQVRILIVDDNRDAADSLALVLKAWGYGCHVAYDGPSGLASAGENKPDCLITDIAMPGIDGYTLAQRVRQQPGLDRTKLVALSAFSDDEHDRRIREAGFDHSLVKPADFDELQRILAMLDHVVRLASKTEEMARQNVELASETKALIQEVREDIREVKQEVRELKQEIREAKDDLSRP